MAEGELYEDYAEQLTQGSEALEYLLARGLELPVIRGAGLGYVKKAAVESHTAYLGRISIPYFDGLGRMSNIRFRGLGESRPKYLQPAGVRVGLYNVKDSAQERVYVTEGEIDALCLKQLGHSAVGLPGANAWKPEFRWLFRDAELVYLATDQDTQGQRLALGIAQDLDSLGIPTVQVALPEGVDVNDMLVKDPEELRRLLDEHNA